MSILLWSNCDVAALAVVRRNRQLGGAEAREHQKKIIGNDRQPGKCSLLVTCVCKITNKMLRWYRLCRWLPSARVPQLEEQVTRLENERWLGYAQPAAKPQRVRLADIERIATKLRVGRLRRPGREAWMAARGGHWLPSAATTRRASFINCAAEFASMKHLYSMR